MTFALQVIYQARFGTRNVEVLNSLITKITAKGKDVNDISQTFRFRQNEILLQVCTKITAVQLQMH